MFWLFRGINPAYADSIPERALIKGIKVHAQSYRLSCEARSASDWAGYWGVKVSETDFLQRLPRSDNPEEGFVGNPNDAWGAVPPASYGVHAQPVAKLLRQIGLPAQARRGMSWREARREIAAGRPVIVWVIGQMWKGTPQVYRTKNGEKVTVANFEHTMILVGYDTKTVQALDAYSGQRRVYKLRNFVQSWKVLGNMAVVYEQGEAGKVELPFRLNLPLVSR
ncbi:MAG: C39 family peptidase [Chloroflexota bacterium]